MGNQTCGQLATILTSHHQPLLESWMSGLMVRLTRRDRGAEEDLRRQAAQFLPQLAATLTATNSASRYPVRTRASEYPSWIPIPLSFGPRS